MFRPYLPSVVISHIVESVGFLLIPVFFFMHTLLLALLLVGGVPANAVFIALSFSVSVVWNVCLPWIVGNTITLMKCLSYCDVMCKYLLQYMCVCACVCACVCVRVCMCACVCVCAIKTKAQELHCAVNLIKGDIYQARLEVFFPHSYHELWTLPWTSLRYSVWTPLTWKILYHLRGKILFHC